MSIISNWKEASARIKRIKTRGDLVTVKRDLDPLMTSGRLLPQERRFIVDLLDNAEKSFTVYNFIRGNW